MRPPRHRLKQIRTLEERLAEEAQRLREAAKDTAPGIEREHLLRKARQCETGSHISECFVAGPKPPV
ncbi:hypothetical protein NLM27_42545 [Bradyrhizobium sp. CCGB12]|nr:hypothetical protein [Bradyrhizobium sp. CCGB12]